MNITGFGFCVGSAILAFARMGWYISRRDHPRARQAEVLAEVWLAAAIVIGSLQ